MPTNHMDEEQRGYGQEFQPFEFDESVEPDLYDGLYEMSIVDVKFRLSNPDKLTNAAYPQLVIEWKAESTYEDSDECKRSVGNTVSEFLTFRPKGDRKGNMSKQRLTLIRNKFGIDSDVVPTTIRSKADFDGLRAVLKSQTATMRAISKMDNTGSLRINLMFEDGEGGGAAEVEEEEQEAAPPPLPAPKANGNGKKHTTKATPKAHGNGKRK